MEEIPWNLKDPEQTLRDVAAICPFHLDDVIVAAVDLRTQAVTGAQVVTTTGHPPDHPGDSELVREVAEALVPERWAASPEGHGITHVLITVLCRNGRVTFTAREAAWLSAWRYANHFRAAFDGDVYIVTPHGWGGSLDHRAGYEPRLETLAA
ncbi:hypothetical protein [Intrasporangium flavum]|uniref:hypothetical protein n=1 Tax=Intrasporangium flavum TaxID=1428657 RepID=UPI00096CAE31|nr:hypothetical protein [Intrasporangium flavum]